MSQKTAVIWDTVSLEKIRFFIVDGDISELDDVYINDAADENDHRQDRLSDLVYDDNGNTLVEFISKEEFESAVRNGAKVIVCGFLP